MSPETLRRISAIRMAAASGEARARRRELRLTLKEVAEVVGVGISTVHSWERGRSVPGGTNALRWARAIDIKVKAN